MEKEYKDYTDRIKKEETKLNALIDNWYKKFSAMETAMAKLQSKNNAVSGMLGG
jgi:flagellar hook-associated protein 2